MFSWFDMFSSTFFSGPARNAPNNGVNIKEILTKADKGSEISQELIVNTLNSLKKTIINNDRPLFYRSPLLCELDEVFGKGNKIYFKNNKREKPCLEIID